MKNNSYNDLIIIMIILMNNWLSKEKIIRWLIIIITLL